MTKEKVSKSSRLKKIFIAFIILGVLTGGYAIYKYMSQPTVHQMPVTAVDVLKVDLSEVYPEVSFVAKIESQEKVALRARVQGFLHERLFKEGDMITKDQPLFVIEKVNFEATVREAEANVAKAAAQVKNKKAQYERAQKLYKTKDVSGSKLDEEEAAFSSAEATLAEAKAKLDLAKKDLEYTTIVSPMDGRIGESVYSVGELIGPNSGVLAEIVAVNPIDAVFAVSENELLSLRKNFENSGGVEVKFIMSDGTVYPETGKINFIDVTIDEAMNTLKIKASFPNPLNQLISGQYGRVSIKSNQPIKSVVIPMKAVQQDMQRAYVYVVNKDNKVEKRDVVRGVELEGFRVEITSGLTVGDVIVTEGFQKIAPNMTVNPQSSKGE
ncbi:MAG: efflux RND transporter periplasmic adaptor subunit [Alphaproteobacteria bacterium]|nr:efflux RND transporter periplasmic adaptor subunit [Alphaproteobacteria bacterium]